MKFTPYRLVVIALRLMAIWFLCEPVIRLMSALASLCFALFFAAMNDLPYLWDQVIAAATWPLLIPLLFLALVWWVSPWIAGKIIAFAEPPEKEQEPKRKAGYAIPRTPPPASGENKGWMSS